MSDSVPPIELPPCELGRLEEISELVILIAMLKQAMFYLNYLYLMMYFCYINFDHHTYRSVAAFHHRFAEKN